MAAKRRLQRLADNQRPKESRSESVNVRVWHSPRRNRIAAATAGRALDTKATTLPRRRCKRRPLYGSPNFQLRPWKII